MTDRPRPATPQPLTPWAIVLVLLTTVFWGANSVAVRYSVDDLPPVAVAAVRFIIGAVFMIGWCRWEGTTIRLQRSELFWVLIVGLLLFAQISLFNLGVRESNSSHGSLFINTFVFWVLGIEHFLTRDDRLTWRKIAGLVLAAGSVFLLIMAADRSSAEDRDVPTLLGDLILCTSAALLGIKVICTKLAVQHVSPGKIVFWQNIVGVVLFVGWSAAFETVHWDRVTPPAIWAVLYQGLIVAGFCFAVQAALMRHYSASQISVFSFFTPLSGVTAGVLFRGDPLSPWLLVAAAGVAGGIICVNWPAAPRPEPQSASAAVPGMGTDVT